MESSAAVELAAAAAPACPPAGLTEEQRRHSEHLQAWEARLAAREAELDRQVVAAGDSRRGEGSRRGGGEGSRRGGLLAQAGDWTVRGGAVFTRALRGGEWSVHDGDVYSKLPEGGAAPWSGDVVLDAEAPVEAGLPVKAPALPAPEPRASLLLAFWRKCRGGGVGGMPRSTVREAAASGVSATLGICTLAALQVGPVGHHQLVMLVASFGASAVLVFSAPGSPLAQPRNLVGGNVLSALAGVCVARAFDGTLPWLAPGVAVGLAVFAMALAGATHPPGGAFALIAVIGGPGIVKQGFLYVLLPALSGSLILLLLGLLCNNVHPGRTYPLRW